MNRRELIKAMGTVTLGACSMSLTTASFGAENSGRYWVFVSAGGGWDVTNWWDPKGSDVVSANGQANNYPSSAIRKAGNLRYAGVPEHVETDDMLHTFTQKHFRKMMVVNGIDQGTNGHSTGNRVSTTGLQAAGVPVFPAMVSAPYASSQSMAYIHQDGHSETAGLVAKSKVLKKADYERLTETTKYIDSESTELALGNKKRELLNGLISAESKDSRLTAMSNLKNARDSSGGLTELLSAVPGELNSNITLSAAEISAAAFKTGIATSASLKVGGFDTHSDNDQRQFSQMDELLSVVDHLWDQLEYHGIAEQTTVVMCSDMGRKPYYDGGGASVTAGKGHWPISSMVFMGADVPGNTVVGSTTDGLKPNKINANTLQEDDNGITITSDAVHDALRRLAGISGSALDQKYPLNAPFINLFG
jgi:uncharacterized protein (DUF1501 family)